MCSNITPIFLYSKKHDTVYTQNNVTNELEKAISNKDRLRPSQGKLEWLRTRLSLSCFSDAIYLGTI